MENYDYFQDFEKRENAILSRVESKETEIDEIRTKVSSSKVKYDAKKKEVEKLQEKEKATTVEFYALLGENHKFEQYLTKVYKKKIKRQTANLNEGSENSSEESSDDDDSDWSDEDSDAEPFDDTVCPTGCDQSLFEKTIELRSRRCAYEDDLRQVSGFFISG